MSDWKRVPEGLIRIGDLSRQTGVPVATLRYYESEGLIECVRTRTRYRMFRTETAELVLRILHLKSLNFPLGEIRQIVQAASAQKQPEDYPALLQRLAHIREQKAIWEEQEVRVLMMLKAIAPELRQSDV